jgi:4,5-DOPA dioxygenase extradiol
MNQVKDMPVLFVGHGSPMNAIEDNKFVREWEALADKIPKPRAILSISAHWFTKGTKIMDEESPETIYDMYGFPDDLYKIVYAAKGSPGLAHKTAEMINRPVEIDNSWGYDHGTWSVLCRIYPKADIPLVQLSIDRDASMEDHYNIGKELIKLREEGVLIFGSGNVTHNLRRLDWHNKGGYDWVEDFDKYIIENVIKGNFDNVIDYRRAGQSADYAVPIADHFAPLLYVLGALKGGEKTRVFNDECILGSLSMTSFLFE